MNTKEQSYILLRLLFKLKGIEQSIEYYSGKSLMDFLNASIKNLGLTYTEFKGLAKYLETTGDIELDSAYFGDVFIKITYRGIRSYELDYEIIKHKLEEQQLGLENLDSLNSLPQGIQKISPQVIENLKQDLNKIIEAEINLLKNNNQDSSDLILSLKTLQNESAKKIPNLEVIAAIINEMRTYIETKRFADRLVEEYNLN
jgi:hypothetical protein